VSFVAITLCVASQRVFIIVVVVVVVYFVIDLVRKLLDTPSQCCGRISVVVAKTQCYLVRGGF
jgi:hypothetical protein